MKRILLLFLLVQLNLLAMQNVVEKLLSGDNYGQELKQEVEEWFSAQSPLSLTYTECHESFNGFYEYYSKKTEISHAESLHKALEAIEESIRFLPVNGRGLTVSGRNKIYINKIIIPQLAPNATYRLFKAIDLNNSLVAQFKAWRFYKKHKSCQNHQYQKLKSE